MSASPSRWARWTDPAAYGPRRIGLDLLLGVVAPILCLAFDPVLLRGEWSFVRTVGAAIAV